MLGDFIHAAAGRVPALDAAVTAWRARHPDLALELVRGNHDRHAGDPPPAWRVAVVAAPHLLAAGPFVLLPRAARCRPPATRCAATCIPGVRLTGAAGDSLRLPCFVLGRRSALLPAFGRLTGLALVSPRAGETVVAIAGATLLALPPVAVLRPEPRGHGGDAPGRRPAGDRSSAGRLLKNLWISGGKYVHSLREPVDCRWKACAQPPHGAAKVCFGCRFRHAPAVHQKDLAIRAMATILGVQ